MTDHATKVELAKLIALKFIQRRDVKAVQFDRPAGPFQPGDWFPDSKIDPVKRPHSPHFPHGFKLQHLVAHLDGQRTYGHYLLDADSKARVFCFDIDLEKEGHVQVVPNWEEAPEHRDDQDLWFREKSLLEAGNLREIWHDRSQVQARNYLKFQLKSVAQIFAHKVRDLGIPCAVAHSGNKGVHVYGFTDPQPAADVRALADIVLSDLEDQFEASKGVNFYKHKDPDPMTGFQNLSVEVFPKQTVLESPDSLGNLVRLPLGKNWKNPKDPTFFLDMTAPLGVFAPHPDPIKLLTSGECFE